MNEVEKLIEKLGQQWIALRYAVDMVDLAWTHESSEYDGDLYEEKRYEMKKRREVLCDLQNEVLQRKYRLEEK